MKSLIKTVPTRQIFDLDVIKKGQIYKIEDRSLEHDSNYIIEDVTETEMHVTALIRGKTFTLKPEHIGVIVKFVCEMELIEKKEESNSESYSVDIEDFYKWGAINERILL